MEVIIVGAGLFGSVVARELAEAGHKVTILEKRDHIAGNIYTKEIAGIQVHWYGAHIFHTSNREVWEYIQQFATFRPYVHTPLANYQGRLFNLPFNMHTFYQLWGTKTPEEAKERLHSERQVDHKPSNLEEQAISLVGRELYETLIKGYTEKQWGRACSELPSFIIKRLPVRFTYDNNYFNDTFQGIPIGGYTKLVERLLAHSNINVHLNTDFFAQRSAFEERADHLVYSGMIDQYFDDCYGALAYRSLRFEHEIVEKEDVQGCAVINYTERDIPYTRIIEHKHFEPKQQTCSAVTKEYPIEWKKGEEAYYPINDQENTLRFKRYLQLSRSLEHVTFGGRLGLYRYCDMDEIIHEALNCAKQIQQKKV